MSQGRSSASSGVFIPRWIFFAIGVVIVLVVVFYGYGMNWGKPLDGTYYCAGNYGAGDNRYRAQVIGGTVTEFETSGQNGQSQPVGYGSVDVDMNGKRFLISISGDRVRCSLSSN